MTSDFILPADHPVFAGHFPAQPIIPGALLLDEVIRVAQIQHGPTPWSVRTAKFVHPAGPEQRLTIELTPANIRGLDFRITLGEQLIASGTLQGE